MIQPSASYRGPVAAAIFDWAGTVLDFGCIAPVEAFREVFEHAGVPISEVEARAPMGAAKREHIALILAMADVAERWAAAHGGQAGEEDVDRLYAHFLSVDAAHVTRHGAMIPGAIDTMAALRARDIRIGSTTGYPSEVMTTLSPLAASQGYVPDHCCTVSDVSRGRPWPDMCLVNAIALQVPDVRACVVVDDSPTGLVSGRAAGMWVVGIAASGNEVGLSLADWERLPADERSRRLAPIRLRLEDAGAHYVIDSVADLLPVIDAIEARLATGETP